MREIGRKSIIAGLWATGFGSERGALLERSRALIDKYPLYSRLGTLR
jgi:hypothetical protein